MTRLAYVATAAALMFSSCNTIPVDRTEFAYVSQVAETRRYINDVTQKAIDWSRMSHVKIICLTNEASVGHGSGAYLSYKGEYYIITATHVIENAVKMSVFEGGIFHDMVPLVVFQNADIAILKIKELPRKIALPLEKVKVADESNIGDHVVYTGYPNLTGPLTVFGQISGHSSQTSIILQSYAWGGASGSLVLNGKGQLVAILSGIELASDDPGKPPVKNETVVIADMIPPNLAEIIDYAIKK